MYCCRIDDLMQKAYNILHNFNHLERYVQNIEIETQQLHQFVLNLKEYQDNILAVNAEILNVKQNVKNGNLRGTVSAGGIPFDNHKTAAHSKTARVPPNKQQQNDKIKTNRSSKFTPAYGIGGQKSKDLGGKIAHYEFGLQNILEEYRRHCNCLSKVGLTECFHSKLLSILNEQRSKFQEIAADMQKISSLTK